MALAAGIVLAAAVALVCALPAWALDVRGECVRDGQHVQLAGDTYAIARIADATVHYDGTMARLTYTTCSPFLEFDASWEYLTASQLHDAAQQLTQFVSQNNLYDRRVVSDAEGVASFPSVSDGLYLVVRESVAPANQDYTCDAVLVSVPIIEEGKAVYEVSIAPKFSWTPPVPPPEPVDPDSNPDPPPADSDDNPVLPLISNLVKTGSLIPGLLVFAVVVAISLVAVVTARTRSRNHLRRK